MQGLDKGYSGAWDLLPYISILTSFWLNTGRKEVEERVSQPNYLEFTYSSRAVRSRRVREEVHAF